jgi:hypothetical protein
VKSAKIQTLCALFATVVLGQLISATAHANARRPGLAGSLLIDDQDDLFFFPNQLTTYQDLISFGYGPDGAGSGSGYGLLTLGNDDLTFGVAIHRGDAQSPHLINETIALGGPADLFGDVPGGSPFTTTPATIFDLLLGLHDLGFRLAVGSGSDTTTDASGDSGESDLFLMGEVGFGMGKRGESTRVDVSGALTLDVAGQQVSDADTLSGTAIGFSGLMRAYFPMEQTLDLGLLVNGGFASTTVGQQMAPKSSASRFDFGLGGGVGPALRLGRATVAGYGIVRLGFASLDPDSSDPNDDSTTHTIVIPGVHMAVEVPLADWFFVRSGAEYDFIIDGSSSTGAVDAGASSRSGTFNWNAGLGVVVNQFRFDGSLQHGFVTGGPNFIGGTTGFLGMASLTYSFDAARKEAASTPEPAAVPEPAPAAAPAPVPEAPAVEEPTPASIEQAPAAGGWLQPTAAGTASVGSGPTTAPPPASPNTPKAPSKP